MDSPLRQYRTERSITLKQVADATGIGVVHLSRFERGQAGVSLHNAIRLSDFTGLPVEVLAQTAKAA